LNFSSGFFNYKNKKYGAFFCAVQTFNKTVFAIPIKDLKSDTLFKAVETMSKVTPPPPTTYPLRLQTDLINVAGARISKSQNFTL
jgi:hypothetical protein